jgi:hypothetical protein
MELDARANPSEGGDSFAAGRARRERASWVTKAAMATIAAAVLGTLAAAVLTDDTGFRSAGAYSGPGSTTARLSR